MSFEAKLFLDDQSWQILNSQFLYEQVMDQNGRPCKNPTGGFIELKVPTDANDGILMNWMLSSELMKNGYVRFYKRDGFTRDFDFEFWDAHCIFYTNSFHVNSHEGLTTTIVISPGVQKVKGAVLEKHWRVTDINATAAPKNKTSTDEEPVLESCYFEDEKGQTLKRAKKDQTIYLVVKSKGMVGKKIDIDLSDSSIDFEYNGSVLENDMLEDLDVTGSVMKIQLKTLKQR